MMLAMDDATLLARLDVGMRQFYRALGGASAGARVIESDGVQACVVPIARERSYPNAVLYADAAALERAYPMLERAYADAGVRAWTVWVPEADQAARRILEARGHRLDATPTAMARAIAGVERPPPGSLEEWTAEGEPAVVGALNDRAYGFGGDTFEHAYAGMREETSHQYVGRVGGVPVTCLCATIHDGNCEIDAVATVPEARGRGLSAQLLAHALSDAVELGATTTTLVATAMGRPIYDRLGYRALGTLQMWERRSG
jgi:GNAT superfamily N-acetyltransferase